MKTIAPFNVERTTTGSVIISTIRHGETIRREYVGLTVKQALAEFVIVLDRMRSREWANARRAANGIRSSLINL